MKTAFVTDSGTGETIEQLSKDGVYSVPLQVSYDHLNFNMRWISRSMKFMKKCVKGKC